MNHTKRLIDDVRYELIEEVEERHQLDGDPVLDLRGKNGRFLAASALQKAIRRNLVPEATTYAGALARSLPSYLPRRLGVIALEDVGQAAPRLVAKALLLASEAELRRQLGTERAFTWLAGELAVAPGDRAACNLVVAAGYHPTVRDDLVGMRTYEQLVAAVESTPGDLVQHVHVVNALVELARRRQFPDAIAVLADRVDPLALWIAWTADKLHLEGLGHGFLVSTLLHGAADAEVVEVPLETSKVGPWIAPALDRHTRPGWQAIKRFAAECGPLADLLRVVRPSRRADAASWLVFAAEGAVLRRRLDYEGTDELERWCAEACLADCRAPIELLDPGTEAVLSHLDLLDELRSQAKGMPHLASS